MEGTCIKKNRTKKPWDSEEWSWRTKQVNGIIIFPGVLNQGRRGVCVFCAITSCGQMELNAAVAKATRKRCTLKLDWESLLTGCFQLHGFRSGIDGNGVRKIMEVALIDKDGCIYELNDMACWCFQHLGVRAVDEEGNSLNLGLHSYKSHPMMYDEDLRKLIEAGKAVKASVLVGHDFHHLQEDEVYAWCPMIDQDKGTWVEEPGRHAIVLLGNGDPGPELDNHQYHPFLNSHGSRYANGGVGCVFYKALLGPLYLLEMKAEPTLVNDTVSQLQDRKVPMPLAYPPRPRMRWPSPPRPNINSARWRD